MMHKEKTEHLASGNHSFLDLCTQLHTNTSPLNATNIHITTFTQEHQTQCILLLFFCSEVKGKKNSKINETEKKR